ncbi:ribbon-helix-helix domain-containing protein [Staphylococcus sp. HMSC13A10]|nr:ribbon-helix-helix domain-containing protein [Staphylococcus sp. HMSC13A10]
MLQPSVRKKLDELVEENNYSSSSEFLNEIIKQLYVN